MIGKVVAHYRILEELGRGGMGVVYKAEDTRLERFVALKFLPKGLNTAGANGDSPRERFKREARAASSLEHPNICTVHEINETDDGRTYMVMPCYQGETLKEKLEKGPLEATEAADIARQMAAGLHKAHEQGIVHRDIKPANILITTDKVVKILDFGLAKLTGPSQLTRTGTTLGTVAYMAPEQAKGEPVDPRTDIWSLGVVLYQMLTGELPFRGDYDQAVIYAILNEEPPAPSTIGKDIDAKLDPIVQRTLARDPARRFPDMMEVMEALQRPAAPTATTGPKEKSIIVLPFEDISPGKDNEYFSDGLTEEIITDLSHIRDLLVISRNSAMTFKGSGKKTREIAAEVKVRYVLEGSVRKAANNLRITAQLIDAGKDTHLWAEKYNGTLDDVFDIQEKVSRSIADSLKIRLSRQDAERIAEKPIDNAAAYECYLKANREIWRFTEDGIDRAIEYLEDAGKMIGENAYIYSALADAHLQYINIGVRQRSTLDHVTAYADKALAMDPDFSKAHAVLGWIEYWYGNNQRSADHFRKALAVNPNEYSALHGLAALLIWQGKVDAAAPYISRMQQIDPLSPFSYSIAGGADFHVGRYQKALPVIEKAFRMDPENRVMEFYYCWTLAYTGHRTEAFSVAERSFEKSPENLFSKLCMILTYALRNQKQHVQQLMDSDFSAAIEADFGYQYLLSVIFALLDEKEQALGWLEKAVSNGYINYPRLNGGDPFLANIKDEDRFRQILKTVKVEWERFAV